jgi:hypothetical protein
VGVFRSWNKFLFKDFRSFDLLFFIEFITLTNVIRKKNSDFTHHLCSSTSLSFIFIFVPDSSHALMRVRGVILSFIFHSPPSFSTTLGDGRCVQLAVSFLDRSKWERKKRKIAQLEGQRRSKRH